jgi:hypothetical protein
MGVFEAYIALFAVKIGDIYAPVQLKFHTSPTKSKSCARRPNLKRSTVSKRGHLLRSDSPDGRFVCPICATPFSEANFSFGIVISGQ